MSIITGFQKYIHQLGTITSNYNATSADTGFNVLGSGINVTLPASPSTDQVIVINNTGSSDAGITGTVTAIPYEEIIVGKTRDTSEAYKYTATGGLVRLGGAEAFDCSADGSIVVGAVSNNVAFTWSAGTGMVVLAGMNNADSCSSDGTIIAGRNSADNPALWSAGTGAVEISAVSSTFSEVYVSADGSIAYGDSGSDCFYWSSGTGKVLFNVGLGIAINAISDDGLYVVGDDGTDAYRFNVVNGIVVGTDVIAGCYAYAISPDGSIVVGYDQASPSGGAMYIWTLAGGKVIIPELDGDARYPGTSVTNGGVIVTGRNPCKRWDAINGLTTIANTDSSNKISEVGVNYTATPLTLPADTRNVPPKTTQTFKATGTRFIQRQVNYNLIGIAQSGRIVTYNYFSIDVNGRLIFEVSIPYSISNNSFAGVASTKAVTVVDNTTGATSKVFTLTLDSNSNNQATFHYVSGAIVTNSYTVDANLFGLLPSSITVLAV